MWCTTKVPTDSDWVDADKIGVMADYYGGYLTMAAMALQMSLKWGSIFLVSRLKVRYYC